MLNKIILPVGLPLMLVLGLTFEGVALMIKQSNATIFLIITIFLINGYHISAAASLQKKRFLKAFTTAVVISLVLFPFFAAGFLKYVTFFHIKTLPPLLKTGFIIISAMPPTISSGIVLASLSGGKKSWAVFFTIGLNLTAVFLIPHILEAVLNTEEIPVISRFEIFKKLFLLVLLPATTGFLLKTFFKKKPAPYLKVIPSFCVLIMVFGFSGSLKPAIREITFHTITSVFLISAVFHTILLLTNNFLSKLLKLRREEAYSFLFVCSQKTLPLSMTVLTIMTKDPQTALIACIGYYFYQLIFDSILASLLPHPARINAHPV